MGKKYMFSCNHGSCLINFKTKRQKYLHHDKLENECRNEHVTLLNLLKTFRNVIGNLYQKTTKKEMSFISYKSLDEEYNKISQMFLDTGRENLSSFMKN